MSVLSLCRLGTALVCLLSIVPSLASAEQSTAAKAPYAQAGNTNKRGDACFSTADTNAAVHLLSGFLEIWTPRTPFVDAGVEAPAKDNCPAVARTDWDGIPASKTDGHIVNQAVHDANIAYVVNATRARTADQAVAAYLDDRRGKNASIVDGLGPLTDAWKAGSKQTTTITEVAADATTVKYDDKGNNRGAGSKPDTENKTDANPDMGFAIDFINAASGDGSTEPAKRYFKYARPYRWSQDVSVVPTLEPAKSGKPVEDGGFPSGHTAEAWRDGLAMAYLVPQRFQEMITRASELGEDRILAGMHSPLDVMAGRMLGTATVVYNLNKAENAALKSDAYAQAQAWLIAKSGVADAGALEVAAHAAPLAADRFADHDANRAYVLQRLSYGLPTIHATDQPARVPQGAEALLETRLPYLDGEQRRDVLKTTEIASGYPLLDDAEGYGRLNLFAAADGYGAFDQDVTVTMDAAKGGFNAIDTWRNDITGKGGLVKRGEGILGLSGANSYAGGTVLEEGALVALSPSAFGLGGLTVNGGSLVLATDRPLTVSGDYQQLANAAAKPALGANGGGTLVVEGKAALAGDLNVTVVDGYVLTPGTKIEILRASAVTGTFGKFTVSGHKASLSYGPTSVTLTIDG
ncbi:phosphatase PAP2 family protein [Rhizobium laguerreae]|uniref:acid phosphatase n=1 Tax=Rhizobium laguerreae TaxID=1076926 RepID=UPI00103D462E|nr:phosphatase PAP2 family protein [Rhizobium laguerreae]MBN9985552.1 phosphatase PAP2 family protein [Rhizobium laguerreae]MBY3094658.1 phosphatase PAP2 family protein [Rhizobium laguerreae]MBY3249029.1 phosphatase PAP2 family protein [Rhizobium laguerreae]MBY3258170.1 phosphatase PAP2 family protein [Rhizobium laguerreae]MBY3286157.1 phosphatase PAP2 family protein [Rhizobium laguerreae]